MLVCLKQLSNMSWLRFLGRENLELTCSLGVFLCPVVPFC